MNEIKQDASNKTKTLDSETDTFKTVDSKTDVPKIDELKTMTTIVYALQAASFLIGFTFIAAVILNYIKKEDVQNTWLESHFRWQIRTFWFSLLWFVLGLLSLILVVGYFILFANAIWLMYRIIKGWLRLSEGKEMYASVAR